MKLPGWVVDNQTSVRREVAPYVGVSPRDSWPLVVQAGSLGSAQLKWDPNPEEALAWRDPLPPSTVTALARLRAQYRAHK